jgi:hypothetical protein
MIALCRNSGSGNYNMGTSTKMFCVSLLWSLLAQYAVLQLSDTAAVL